MSENKEKETMIPDDLTVNNILNTNQKIGWMYNIMVIIGSLILLFGTILLAKAYITHVPFMIGIHNRGNKSNQLLNYYASITFSMSFIVMFLVPYIDRFSLIEIKKFKLLIFISGLCLMSCSLFLYYCEYQSKDNWWGYCEIASLGGFYAIGAIADFLSAKLKKIFNNSSIVFFLLFILFCILSGSPFLPINI